MDYRDEWLETFPVELGEFPLDSAEVFLAARHHDTHHRLLVGSHALHGAVEPFREVRRWITRQLD